MKKVCVFLLLFAFMFSFVLAQENVTETAQEEVNGIQRAYQCLEDIISEKDSSNIALQEATFSTLALGSKTKLKEARESEESNNCWPKSGCKRKETSQVLLAYDRINKNTKDIESFLLSKNTTATDLTWFLQIDISNHNPSTCTLSYSGSQRDISIGEDMKISGNPGTCFTVTASGFWLKVKSSCLDEKFQISCDEDFITSLLYQKSGSSTIFISPNTNSASSSGTTSEKVNSQCFKTGSVCDYEGTLWAALALQKVNYGVSPFLPYLLALSEENKNLLPSSFLYALTQGDDQYSELVQDQKQGQFWKAPSSKYNKFYDTALAMQALQSSSSTEFENAKTYLLDIQTPEGCWNNNNLRDTAFLLYAGWPKSVSSSSDGGGDIESCGAAGFFCGPRFACVDAGGQAQNSFFCPGFDVCCDTPILELTCAEKGGIKCGANQECSVPPVSSAEGSCCLDTCRDVSPQINECEQFAGICAFNCNEDESQESYLCDDFSSVCCVPSQSSSSSFTGIIVILVILIILVVLGILFRNKIKIWFHRRKSKKRDLPSRGPGQRPPGFPPRRGPPFRRGRIPPRQVPRGAPLSAPVQTRSPPKTTSKEDKDFEDTLNKLKEMSK
jgi:hypothetical protein